MSGGDQWKDRLGDGIEIDESLSRTFEAEGHDLESLLYMLVYFLKGSLPWMGFTAPTSSEKYRKIKNSKLKHPPNILCQVGRIKSTLYLLSEYFL